MMQRILGEGGQRRVHGVASGRDALTRDRARRGNAAGVGSASGSMAQVFLGTAASKILRHAPVPVMIVPKHHT
jgi:nucleotide-binding universal stress UspA family protein